MSGFSCKLLTYHITAHSDVTSQRLYTGRWVGVVIYTVISALVLRRYDTTCTTTIV